MLRRSGQAEVSPESSNEGAYPSLAEPFLLEERSSGVCFYKGRESFFYPYALLQSMSLRGDKLTLSFSSAEVVITGRALHALYVHLASHRVARIIEQGERYAGTSEAGTFVCGIEEIPN